MDALIFKKLAILPDGNHVKGGYFEYNFDPEGHILYDGRLETTMMAVPLAGQSAVDPSILQSTNITPGLKFNFGALAIEVTAVAGGIAQANVQLTGDLTASGWAKFDLSQAQIALKELLLSGKYPMMFFSLDFTVHALLLNT